MSNLGIYIELKDGNFKKSNKETLSFAGKSGKDIYAVVFADDIGPYMDELKGVKKVIQVKGENLTYQPDAYADTMAKIIKDFDLEYFLGIFSAQARDLFPRITARTGNAGLINDCLEIDLENNLVIRPVYAGKLLCQYSIAEEVKILTLRPNVFPAAEGGSGDPEVTEFDLVKSEPKTKILEVIKSESKKIDLSEAEIIVSGGRGMKTKENFAILEEMAALLNAGVGASRAAVDSEYATYDMQVGQTGKVVNPKLYIACGISGAIQHLVGMKTSKVIVAINKDPEAPIFKKADYGIVADLFKAVPLLTEELKAVV
ncbi:MAG: electron transfer flavoprotein subunit alpha/FixB family protein [Candidatus Aminicenantes bacterium]|nr:electron transfer flavoprotein subunit alpha/FixB family protein [Candidatus Aminicenantes bacterium]